ncbi:hypothetical protein C0Q70_13380 [Pomacea canaliculata]|uniref:Uncharacterized protein n=1 Tax=Pomacea canaliculata TaxID=400727 RepID=A0A2T7NX23_POMCA|nr:hypothetical protein C0Q70_13380 [Pomacea canaliculata]
MQVHNKDESRRCSEVAHRENQKEPDVKLNFKPRPLAASSSTKAVFRQTLAGTLPKRSLAVLKEG